MRDRLAISPCTVSIMIRVESITDLDGKLASLDTGSDDYFVEQLPSWMTPRH